ncbi:MAG: hypothetical protein ACK6DZ_24455 [Acidobacteriota bacterium]
MLHSLGRIREGQSAQLVAETVVATRPSLLVRDSKGTIYFSAWRGSEIYRFRDGEEPVLYARVMEPLAGLALRDDELVVSTSGATRLWIVDGTGKAQALTLVGSTTVLLPEFQITTLGNGEIGAIAFGEFWRINRQNELSRSALDRYGNAAARQGCPYPMMNSAMVREADGAIWFRSSRGLCRRDATGTIWFLEGRQTNTEQGGETGGSGVSPILWVGGMTLDEKGRLLVSDTERTSVRQLELVREGAPYSLQPRELAVRGAGGSLATLDLAIARGGLVSIYGSQFAPAGTARGVGRGDLVGGKLPTKLAGTCVRVEGELAPLTFVGTNQINAQVPNLSPMGTTWVTVVANCGEAEELEGAGVAANVRGSAPEFLYWVNRGAGNNPVVAVEAATGALLGPANLIPGASFRAARSGEVITVYGVGFGATTPNPESGAAVSGPAPTSERVFLYLGENLVEAGNVLYAGASPGIVGLYQVNFRIPSVGNGEQKLRIRVGSDFSPGDGYLWIQNPAP